MPCLVKLVLDADSKKLFVGFGKLTNSEDGLQSRCKFCRNEEAAIYRSKNRSILRTRSLKWSKDNPAKAREQKDKWAKDNPEKVKVSVRKNWLKKYGLTMETYDAKLKEQQEKCFICKTNDPGSGSSKFVVDHKHVLGFNKMRPEEKIKYVRGLLCNACNLTIGAAKEDPARLQACSLYLEIHKNV